MRFLAVVGFLAILAAIGAGVYFLGGFFNVGATRQDPAFVSSAIIYVRQASIGRHAVDQPPMNLEDPATIQAGAKAFSQRGCVNCHGGPGAMWAKFSEGLNPGPPDLKEVVNGLEARELFWVVKNGIGMTGMPSFGAIGVPDQEIWSIAAFLKKLPSVSEQDYKTWTAAAP